MADRITPEHRSWNMSRIRGRNTGPELRVRSITHRLGFRFSIRRIDLPGKPDIVLPSHRTVIFVHGCFWHRHKGCTNSVVPKTRREFWLNKLDSNVLRDRRNAKALKDLGWRVLVVWECELEDEAKLRRRIMKVLDFCNAS
ncbi:MAG: very short patch repair endonuclease [Terriglobia bacterium]